MSLNDLDKLHELRQKGALTEEEFQREKARLLAGPYVAPAAPTGTGAKLPWGMPVNTFCMLMHLSQFAGLVVPFAGLVLPIVMWATTKQDHPETDHHGRIILNWMISAFIYGVVCFVLCFVIIGIPMAIALAICHIVFVIMGAVKANDGRAWPYPMSIRFLALPGSAPDAKPA